jgi:magnesium transporter
MAEHPVAERARIELFGWTDTDIEFVPCGSLADATQAAARYRFVWIDIEGVATADCALHLEHVAELSPLAADTLVEGVRRAGADDFGDLTIVTMRSHAAGGLVEFIDFLLSPRILATIQEKSGGDSFEPVRDRLRRDKQRFLRADPNVVFLLLGRQVCEGYKPLLEQYSEGLEKFERALVRRPDSSMLDRIHEHRRKLLFLRQGLAPLREALANLQASLSLRQESAHDTRGRLAALRELQDEVGALLDVVEFQKDSAQHLLDLYLNAASNRLNEIVRVLTIISVIFMPLTLIAGIYGMNFADAGPWSMPELRWRYGYPFALGLMVACTVGLLLFFHHKGWIGDPLARRHAKAAPSTRSTGGPMAFGSPISMILSRRRGRSARGSEPR